MKARETVLRRSLCLLGLLLPALLWPLLWSQPVAALCVAPSMQGDWINTEQDGVLRRIDLRFKCCDQVNCPVGQPCVTICSPKENSVRVVGPCATGNCDWGEVVPDYLFQNEAGGYQFTRVDARFQVSGEVRRLVILLLGADELLVHWSVDYPDGSDQKDFSLIERFEREHCVTWGSITICDHYRIEGRPELSIDRRPGLYPPPPKILKK
ncbi:MAG: hypothetical protein V2A71_08175 [Candidatus Eisenbacteria bacterium]